MSRCEDCGCKVYNGACTNCHEETYILDQYLELGMPVPSMIKEKADEQRPAIEDARRKERSRMRREEYEEE